MDKRNLPKTKEHKEKIRLAQLGKARPYTTGKNNGMWKEKAKYAAIHMWVKKWKGEIKMCSICGKTNLRPRQYQWANIDHKYRRVLDDYIEVCASCHQRYDIEFNNYRGGKRKL
jgi:hypothetical protein